ncbi:MAG: hypothetical protein HZA24_09660 [Nitrospirae bacterium]|nr:hypothetical protein [Nitrospirota bacterium]
MKHIGAAALSLTLFVVAWSIVAGLLTAGSLAVGPNGGVGIVLAWGALTAGPLVGGFVAVFGTCRWMRELPTGRVWGSYAAAMVLFAVVFTAPWYLIEDGIGQGTPQQLQAVVLAVAVALAGGFLGHLVAARARRVRAAG